MGSGFPVKHSKVTGTVVSPSFQGTLLGSLGPWDWFLELNPKFLARPEDLDIQLSCSWPYINESK